MADNLVSIEVSDYDGDIKRVPVFFPAATTPAEMASFYAAFAPLLDAIIDGRVGDATITQTVTRPAGMKAAPVANSEVQKGAQLSFLNASRYKWGVYIPSVTPGLFIADALDTTDADVQALVTAYTAGLGGVLPSNGLAFDLTSLVKATKSFRK